MPLSVPSIPKAELEITLEGKKDATGFLEDYGCTLTYDETARTITITPTGSTFTFYVKGQRFVKTGAQTSAQHPGTDGGHFFYYDDTGTLITTSTPWDLLEVAPVAFVFWDSLNNRGIAFEERHHAGRDIYWHRNQHTNEGTKASSGFGIGDYTLNNGTTDNAVTFSIATGRAEDEDIRVDTQALPNNGPYTILERAGAGGPWRISRSSTLPYLVTGNNLEYNTDLGGGNWGRAVVPEDQFVNYWVFGTTAIPTTSYQNSSVTTTQQIVIIPGQQLYASDTAAHAENVATIQWGAIPFQEIVPLYQITVRRNATAPAQFTNTARMAITRAVRIVGTAASITQSAVIDHGALSGLSDDDHLIYARADGTRGDFAATGHTHTSLATLSVTGNFTAGTTVGDSVTVNAGTMTVANNLAVNTDLLYFDVVNERIGVRNSAPYATLTVRTKDTDTANNARGIVLEHYDNTTAFSQAKFIGSRARGSIGSPTAVQGDDSLVSFNARGYKATAWSNTVGGLYVYAASAWNDGSTPTYITLRGVNTGTTVDEYARFTLAGVRARSFRSTAVNLGNVSGSPGPFNVDCSLGDLFHGTAIGNTVWAFINPAGTGLVTSFTLELANGGLYTMTWPATVAWDSGAAPTLTSSGTDILTFYTRDGGTSWRGFVAAKDSKVPV